MLITSDLKRTISTMCPAINKADVASVIADLQAYPAVFADLVMTTGAALVALVAANNVGVNTAVQASPAAALHLGGEVYVLTFGQLYSRLVRALTTSIGPVPACSDLRVIGDGVAGGVATIVCTTVTAGKTITLTVPGIAAPVVLTAVAFGSGPTNSQYCIGDGGANGDADTATYIAETINNTVDAANTGGCAALVGGPISAQAINAGAGGGTCVVITSSIPGVTIAVSDVAKLVTVTDQVHTTTAARTMQPGVVLQGAVSATPAIPVTGNEYRMRFDLQQ